MKKIKLIVLTLVLVIAVQASIPVVQTAHAATGTTQTTKKKNGLKKEKGKYCFYENGKKVKKSFRTVKGKKYYFQKNGAAATGWYKIGNKAYHFTSKGVMEKNKTVDEIKLNKKGYVSALNERVKLKFQTISIVKKITKTSMSKEQKLKACYSYILKCTYLMRIFPITGKNWEVVYAADMLTNKKGNCYSYAAAFAMLAKECGYKAEIIKGNMQKEGQSVRLHAWVEINGRVYDPQSQVSMNADFYNKAYSEISEIQYMPN